MMKVQKIKQGTRGACQLKTVSEGRREEAIQRDEKKKIGRFTIYPFAPRRFTCTTCSSIFQPRTCLLRIRDCGRFLSASRGWAFRVTHFRNYLFRCASCWSLCSTLLHVGKAKKKHGKDNAPNHFLVSMRALEMLIDL